MIGAKGIGNGVGEKTKNKKLEKSKNGIKILNTYPSRFALVFECLLGVLSSSLHKVHCVLHVVFNAVNHLAL